MLSHLIYPRSTFITSDRVIIHGVTAGREEMQIHKLFRRLGGTRPTQTPPLPSTCCVSQSESSAQRLIDFYSRDEMSAQCCIGCGLPPSDWFKRGLTVTSPRLCLFRNPTRSCWDLSFQWHSLRWRRNKLFLKSRSVRIYFIIFFCSKPAITKQTHVWVYIRIGNVRVSRPLL